MATNKTNPTVASVSDFINALADETQRADAWAMVSIMQQLTGLEAKMWGPGIIGFGSVHYTYQSGRQGDMPLACFSPRKASIALYLASGFRRKDEFLPRLGKVKADKGCLHIKRLADVDTAVLADMIAASIAQLQEQYPEK